MHKTKLQAHLVFCVKYRKKILKSYGRDVKRIFEIIANNSDFSISTQEIDSDHIHCLVLYDPKISISQIVRKLKQDSTRQLWNQFPNDLRQHFWKANIFWSSGYFATSIGDASEETIRKYIESQG